MANAITRLTTWLRGERVGEDEHGNVYYQDRKTSAGSRRRRWVIYKDGLDEASRVPPQHHAWLHYTIDAFPSAQSRPKFDWQRDHVPNLTGTVEAYRPPGHTLAGGRRASATGDYEAWSPE
ncbi:MAG: NADH:ubiquinone oxidoreductase subunit NDUFA12 [Alphaproteobacteria bacterium]|jgi:NADH:ubiquinone oxidoreductase subunit|uniref:NADH:ubiquinone oxidoreductase subunit NDUFA12 n=1 Tax=Pacificispira sp. TaxID=2888761 RepID=UPI001B0B7E2E|nr:NADH:ubiquinone oxidoreductase subunit NDUFA12 [Alphaproteobacteria bacterium]MEC9265958.1 NADH:ubiquinone oxidoreductase subunit NDUFA12 [Pseudomonadota bacterium]